MKQSGGSSGPVPDDEAGYLFSLAMVTAGPTQIPAESRVLGADRPTASGTTSDSADAALSTVSPSASSGNGVVGSRRAMTWGETYQTKASKANGSVARSIASRGCWVT
jgi:hypothetical protein